MGCSTESFPLDMVSFEEKKCGDGVEELNFFAPVSGEPDSVCGSELAVFTPANTRKEGDFLTPLCTLPPSANYGSCGVLLMWDKRVVELTEECIGEFSVATLLKNVVDEWEWAFARSYGPNMDRDRRRLWEELAGLYALWEKTTLLEELQDLEDKELLGENSEEVFLRKGTVIANLERALLSEEISWLQKSRAIWLKEVQYYETLLTESATWRPKLDALHFEAINSQSVSVLERFFVEEEIYKVISGMAKDKAPGPDGFSMGFFQTCWDIVKGDIMQIFSEFHAFQKFEKSLNATFIALIPKKHEALTIEDFQPISLVSNVYKIISKVLANRLSLVLEHIISKSHNAFIQGRQILDSVLIANECLDYRVREGGSVMEALSRMIQVVVGGGFLSGFQVDNGSGGLIIISHLLFADDTLVFCEANRSQIQTLRALLLCFEAVLGLKVNLGKSEMVCVGAVSNIIGLASLLDYKVSYFPMKYLGLPLGATFKNMAIWDGVVEKIKKKLAS
ncbi:uncharacterized protein LOC118348461 [Juglans regia]|uniref:Uncharacterized protein LOC118348461 n=1 Tax=Juglans regia TaxID=51240 RepID=A0A6P9ETT8_JUGRE|nr:uncharacterized protein LOC118348461 [Juglans regia]